MHTRFLTVPGLASSGPRHWQSIWEEQYPDLFKRVHQHNWDWPVRDEWVAKLQEEVRSLEEPVILVAHSLGCMTVAQWAQDYSSPMIEGALLVAPADAEVSKRLSFVIGFNPIPANTLPFKSVVVASTNDIYASIGRSQKFAESWKSEFINLGKKGHINAVSGLGDWEDGKRILERLSNTKFVGVQ